MPPIEKIQREHGIVGREAELAMALAVLGAGRHLLLEGPVGVGKTTVARHLLAPRSGESKHFSRTKNVLNKTDEKMLARYLPYA